MPLFRAKAPLPAMLAELCGSCFQVTAAMQDGTSKLDYNHPFWASAKALSLSDTIQEASLDLLDQCFVTLLRCNFVGEHASRLMPLGVRGVDSVITAVATEIRRQMPRDQDSSESFRLGLENLLNDLYTFMADAAVRRPDVVAAGNQHRMACEFLGGWLAKEAGDSVNETEAIEAMIVMNGLAALMVTQQAQKAKPVLN